MTIEKAVKASISALVYTGAEIGYSDILIGGFPMQMVVGLVSFPGDDVLLWCDWFPEDQHHFHPLKVLGVRVVSPMEIEILSHRGLVTLRRRAMAPGGEAEAWARWVSSRGNYAADMEVLGAGFANGEF